jgi:riboflavin kinase/FMN adenylyltransferase
MFENKIGISLALGTFDGLHLGHMAVIEAARNSEFPMCALLFDEHPLKVLTGMAPPEIMCPEMLKKLCKEYAVEAINISFKNIKDMSAEEFFSEILIKKLNVRELSCGENYTFGKGGKGNAELLKKLCNENDIRLNVVPTVMYNGEPISSTRIRKCLENGEIKEANKMLGRPFSYIANVIDGEKRGRKLGFPTANQILPDSFVQLKHGVYATVCNIDSKLCPAVTNYGIRPTFDGEIARSETYIIDYKDNLYGESLEIRFLDFLREEKKFPDTDSLVKAISEDCKNSIKLFRNYLK